MACVCVCGHIQHAASSRIGRRRRRDVFFFFFFCGRAVQLYVQYVSVFDVILFLIVVVVVVVGMLEESVGGGRHRRNQPRSIFPFPPLLFSLAHSFVITTVTRGLCVCMPACLRIPLQMPSKGGCCPPQHMSCPPFDCDCDCDCDCDSHPSPTLKQSILLHYITLHYVLVGLCCAALGLVWHSF